MSEAGRQQLDIAKKHAAAVTSALNAINAYAEWAPLPDLANYGIIHGYDFFLCGYLQCFVSSCYFWCSYSPPQLSVLLACALCSCGFLLSSPDFRLHACEFFKLVSPRYAL